MSSTDYKNLEYMLEAANAALVFVQGRNRDLLFSDQKLIYALVRAIELVGEAASRVSPDTRAEYPGIPWVYITNLGSYIAYGDDINLNRVWDAVDNQLPGITNLLSQVVAMQSA